MFQRQLVSLNLMNQHLLVSNFTSAASCSLSVFIELKSVRALLWIRLWLAGILWLVWSNTFSVSAMRFFCSLIFVFTGVALLIYFKNFSIAFTTWLAVWYKRPSVGLVSTFGIPFSLSLIISIFWFKMRQVWPLPFTWALRGHHSIINWPNFSIILSQEIRMPEQREINGKLLVVEAVKISTFID